MSAVSMPIPITLARSRTIACGPGASHLYLDADDIWEPRKLQEQVEIFDREPTVGMVYGRSLIWHSWDPASRKVDFFYELGVTPNRSYDPPHLLDLLLTNKFQTPTTCNAIMRRSVINMCVVLSYLVVFSRTNLRFQLFDQSTRPH